LLAAVAAGRALAVAAVLAVIARRPGFLFPPQRRTPSPLVVVVPVRRSPRIKARRVRLRYSTQLVRLVAVVLAHTQMAMG